MVEADEELGEDPSSPLALYLLITSVLEEDDTEDYRMVKAQEKLEKIDLQKAKVTMLENNLFYNIKITAQVSHNQQNGDTQTEYKRLLGVFLILNGQSVKI